VIHLVFFFFLSSLLGVALLSAIGLATLSRLRRRSYRRAWWILGSITLIVGVLWLDSTMFPAMDDGPFVGEQCTSIPNRPPDQILKVAPGHLEVFDVSESQVVPIILRRRTDGNVAWCIAATGSRGTSVRRVRFSRARLWVFGFVVDGTVDWTYGVEHTRWLFWWTGALRSYWFSW
jgi:hypothetical protein